MKQKVAVVVLHTKEGDLIPLFIVWDNMVKYPIDKVISKQKAASLKSGGFGIRYTIRVQNQYRYLFYEYSGWFIEKIPAGE